MDPSGTTHKRIYHACDNCRTKRVRCHLGSVDQPQNPPCARCKRENKECVFSSRRRKALKVNYGNNRNPQKEVEMTSPDVSLQYEYRPVGGDRIQTESAEGQQAISALFNCQAYTSNDTLEFLHEAHKNGGNAIADVLCSSSGKESGNRSTNEASQNIALKTWNSLRFVQAGLFTAGEALSYVNWFYIHLAPFSPVPTLRYKDPLLHVKLIEEEPILALTILTIAARCMKLNCPGSVTRGNIIHDRLWNYLRGMIGKVFWSEENLMSEKTTTPGTPLRSVLRTVGTCEALLLLLEWYPRALHFPAVDNDSNSIIVCNGIDRAAHETAEARYGRMRSGVDWLSRSDRMCWSLLGLAQSLAVELGLFEKQDIRKSEEDVERAHRIQQLLGVFSIQTSGRLGWKYLPTLSMTMQSALTGLDDSTQCWVGIASLLKKGHELLFSTPKHIYDLVNKREYGPILRILQALLEDWRRDFEAANLSKKMRWILTIEYEYVRVYFYSIVLQAVIERLRKEEGPASDQIVRADGQREDTNVLYDGLYLGYLTSAARSLLHIIADNLFPEGYLLYAPVRTYSRILSAAVYLLKTCAVEVQDTEARKSLDLVIRTAMALQTSFIDDLHLSPRWGALLLSLCSSLSTKPTNAALRNHQATQNNSDPERKSHTLSSSPLQVTPFMSTPTGTVNPSYPSTDLHNLGTIQSSLDPDLQSTYDMFSWADPVGGMDISQMPWNGDQAIFDILASGISED